MELPAHMDVVDDVHVSIQRRLAFNMGSLLASKWLWKLLVSGEFIRQPLRSKIQGLKYLFGALVIKNYLLRNHRSIDSNAVLYSYWFSTAALGFTLFKLEVGQSAECSLITRGHGYDVFCEQRNVYIPFRELTLSQLDCVYSISKTGAAYLKNRHPTYTGKIRAVPLGIEPVGTCRGRAAEDTAHVSFVSCSSVSEVKRVDLIFHMIGAFARRNPDKAVRWTHMGAGPLFDKLHQTVQKAGGGNLSVDLVGVKSRREVYEAYRKMSADIFVNLSSSEGIPVSIMEAISAGIPVLAPDVGAMKEIVCAETGVLLPAVFSEEAFCKGAAHILASKGLRGTAIAFFESQFMSQKNYDEFYRSVLA
jgi:glycosyltransferase involved in cell wall biosynthesis